MVLLGAFVDVEGDVCAVAVSAVASTPAFAAHFLSDLGHLLFSLHGVPVASQISSPVDSASLAVEAEALCSCC